MKFELLCATLIAVRANREWEIKTYNRMTT